MSQGYGPPQTMPQYYLPQDREAAEREFKGGRESRNLIDGVEVRYADILGPRGEKSWKDVPTGYRADLRYFLLPSWHPSGSPIFVVSRWHFIKTNQHPKGLVVGCADRDHCEVCRAREAAKDSPDPRLQKAASWAKPRAKWLYQVACLDLPNYHTYEDGTFRPVVLGASYSVHDGMINLEAMRHRSIIDSVHPQQGHGWVLSKRKTGGSEMDVEYGVLDMPSGPLPQYFWGLLQGLWDLNKLVRTSTDEERHVACLELGLITGGASVQVPPGYGYPQQPGYGAPPAAMVGPYAAAPGMGVPGYPQAPAQSWGQQGPQPYDPLQFPPPDAGYPDYGRAQASPAAFAPPVPPLAQYQAPPQGQQYAPPPPPPQQQQFSQGAWGPPPVPPPLPSAAPGYNYQPIAGAAGFVRSSLPSQAAAPGGQQYAPPPSPPPIPQQAPAMAPPVQQPQLPPPPPTRTPVAPPPAQVQGAPQMPPPPPQIQGQQTLAELQGALTGVK